MEAEIVIPGGLEDNSVNEFPQDLAFGIGARINTLQFKVCIF